MASFTDQPVNFAPYIPVNPVEAMLQVGMTKQQQYAEGLQKVQTYVDTLGGLDISKQEVKDYVQSKMNELHQNLNNVSGDFSDNRLVAQIGGAASKIANDPIVQNGILATSQIRSGYQKMEASRKEGKSNPNNEIYFTDAVQAWQTDGQVDTKFSGEYTPFYDIVGEVRKIYKDMSGGQDLPPGFNLNNVKTDSLGRPIFDLNYSKNMVLMEGISVERLQGAIDLVMSNGNSKQQLNIDGYAKYRGIEGPQMFNALVSSTNKQLSVYNEALKAAQSKLGGATDGDKVQLIADIKRLKELSDRTVAKSDDLVKGLGNNLAGVKAQLVEDEMTADLLGTFAYQKMVESPLWNQNIELERLQLQKDEFRYRQLNDERNYLLAQQKEAREKKTQEEAATTTFIGDLPVPNTEGQAGSASMYKLKQDALGEAGNATRQSMYDYVRTIPEQKQPYKLDPVTNRWVPNAEDYGGGPEGTRAAQADADRLALEMASRAAKGTLKPEQLAPYQKQQVAWDNYNLIDKRIKDTEAIAAPQMETIKQQVGTRRDGSSYPNDWFEAYKVDKELPGHQLAEQNLVAKYGPGWRYRLGISQPVSVGMSGQSTYAPNYGDYLEFSRKLKKNESLVNVSQDIENRFKASQIAHQNKATIFKRGTPELQKDIKSGFTAALTEQSLATEGRPSDANKLKDWMSDKPEKQTNDEYMAWTERAPGGQQTWWIGIQRGDEFRKVQVKQTTFQQNTLLQQAIPNVEFQDMFGLRLGIRGGRDTYRDENDRLINGGQAGSFAIPVQNGSISYTDGDKIVEGTPSVQVHLEEPATAPGRYAIKLFITDARTGKVLVPGALYPPADMFTPGETPALTQEQVMSMIKRTLSNPTSIQGYLDTYYNKKK